MGGYYCRCGCVVVFLGIVLMLFCCCWLVAVVYCVDGVFVGYCYWW